MPEEKPEEKKEKKPEIHYQIVGNAIKFDVDKITKTEMKQIKKLADGLGYKLQPLVKPKEKKEANPQWTEKAIRAYLDEYGTKAQKEKFADKYNAPILDEDKNPVLYRKDSKDGKHKKGDIRIKGFVATIQWFKKQFPDFPDAPKAK